MKRPLLSLTRALSITTALCAGGALAHEDAPHPGKGHGTKAATPATPAAPATPATPAAPAAPAAHGHAPGDHAHESPHGGLVGTVDKDTHVEVLFSETAVQVWWYDADMKPVALPTDAKATVVIGKEVKKLELPVAKNANGTAADHLGAPLPTVKDQKLSIVIQATVAGKARSARVERAPLANLQLPPAAPATK